MYLDTKANIWNDIGEEIKTGIVATNGSCSGLEKHPKSRILTISTKIQLYKTLINPLKTKLV
jgi:hypothetical protein